MMKQISCVFKDNNIQMNTESLGGRVNKFLFVIPSVSHLRYDKFKQKCKGNLICPF